MNTRLIGLFLLGLGLQSACAQTDYWQQKVVYEMEIDFNTSNHRFAGKQKIKYTNNSPDTLKRVFYHLYFNAFQPGSMMDVRSRTIPDPDPRVGSRISRLRADEQGYHTINSLQQDGQALQFEVEGTILEVTLAKPILPQTETVFEMDFESQVPLQVRRSGRNNAEGIDYSMTQWYPKLAEYDQDGWHADPYVAREFHGVWGDFDVKISIDADYVVAATGYLQNPEEIGHGYEKAGTKVKRPGGDKLNWHFKASDVHDFAWAADPDYIHTKAQVPNGPELHFFYQGDTLVENWKKLPEYTIQCFEIMNEMFGKYPYDKYSVVQGGDGGMEYAMATLITGHRSLPSLVSVTVHEAIHSWYQMVLGTDEGHHPWMDEGYTSYAQAYVLAKISGRDPMTSMQNSYYGYFAVANSPKAEPMSTPADYYQTNRVYSINAYSKGAVLLHQLSYIIGEETFFKGMRRYFNTWKFKHPSPRDFKRVMEKESGLELDWYFDHWVNTINAIDYGIASVEQTGKETQITLERKGNMPMPIDLVVTLSNGSTETYYIPLRVMRGEKKEGNMQVQNDWPWTHPTYSFTIPHSKEDIKSLEIDPSKKMADVERSNNTYPPGKRRK